MACCVPVAALFARINQSLRRRNHDRIVRPVRPQSPYTARVDGAEVPLETDSSGLAVLGVHLGPRTELTIVLSA